MKPFVLGVAGVIGSGKSTFCRFLQSKFGFHYINADRIVHKRYEAGGKGYEAVKKNFGACFVSPSCVSRAKLRNFLLRNPSKIRILNKLIHPLVRETVSKKLVQIKRCNKGGKRILTCIEASYFEPKILGEFVDQVIILDAPDNVILERLKEKRMPAGQLKALLKFQRRVLWNL